MQLWLNCALLILESAIYKPVWEKGPINTTAQSNYFQLHTLCSACVGRRGYILHLVACVPSQSFSPSFNYKEWERRWHHALVFFIHWIGATHSNWNYNPDYFLQPGAAVLNSPCAPAASIKKHIFAYLLDLICEFWFGVSFTLWEWTYIKLKYRSELFGVSTLDFEWKQMAFLFIPQPRGVCLSIKECALAPSSSRMYALRSRFLERESSRLQTHIRFCCQTRLIAAFSWRLFILVSVAKRFGN